jgi:TRAP-type C4-dicarboxylate transport system permease small subunit
MTDADGPDPRPGPAPLSASAEGNRKVQAIGAFVAWVERVGGVVLGGVAALTFASVILRYVANAPIPDSFDFSRLLIGIVILWGLASASFYGEHIQFDLIWNLTGKGGKRIIDLCATTITLAAIAVMTWMLGVTVYDSYVHHGTTSGLAIVLWPFYFAAWLGAAFATLFLIARILRLSLFRGDFRAPVSGETV